ncbi:MAG: precorrin-2 C(20)-methyltransferase [Oscillospiraceae bacterium]|nr:precorrin-2 C(20)-methyltransferase [Oscillospiraceae bacterium]
MKGKLYGIGTGPGDPELLTLKAINTIERCSVIAVPKSSGDGERVAYSIVEKYVIGKQLHECHFPMVRDLEERKKARLLAAEGLVKHLDDGKDVAFVTLGDPTTYSTYMYMHEIVVSQGYEAEIVPGITSFAASAAALGISLCEGDETLMIIPASQNERIEELLRQPGNKVIMKSGRDLAGVLEKLKELGYGDKTKVACEVSMENQQLYMSIDEYEKAPEGGYFTLVIVKEKD